MHRILHPATSAASIGIVCLLVALIFFFSSRRRHTRLQGDWSSDVCSSDLSLAGSFWIIVTHLTSSLMVVRGNSGPYLPKAGSPFLLVTGLALPYGLPRVFRQTTKNLVVSKAWPWPPKSGPHQSATSALPLRA